MNPDAPHNMAAGAYNWGKFSEKDLETIKASFVKSFKPLNSDYPTEEYEFHFYVQLYALNFTNIRVACLAAFDWCLTRDENIVSEGRLFATYDSGGKFTSGPQTLGSAKDKVNRALIEGICNEVLLHSHKLQRQPQVALTHETFSSALSVLPEKINVGPVITDSIIIYQGDAGTTFRNLKIPRQTNWAELLGLKAPYVATRQ